jgi:hypothetical protein
MFSAEKQLFWMKEVSHRGRRDYVLALEAGKQILKGKPVLITPHSLTKQSYVYADPVTPRLLNRF